MDKQIAELYFENNSNMEFVTEPEVKEYLSSVHDFLNTYFHRSVSLNIPVRRSRLSGVA